MTTVTNDRQAQKGGHPGKKTKLDQKKKMAEPDNCPLSTLKKNMAVFDFWDEKKVVLSITFYSACKKSEVVF